MTISTTDKAETDTTTQAEDQDKPQPEAAADKQPAPAADAEKSTDAADKTKDSQTPDRVVPEAYDLKPVKDSLLTAENVEAVKEFAKANKLTNAEAQAVLERENAVIANYVKAQEQQADTVVQKWLEEVKADKEIGGENFAKTAEIAKRAIDRFAPSQAFKDELDKSGLGNHPDFVRFAYAVGKAMADDTFEKGGTGGPTRKPDAEVFYGPEKGDAGQ